MDFRGALRVDLAVDDSGLVARSQARPDAPIFTVVRGRTVMLAITNRASAAWALHPHGHCVRLLDRLDDGWKPFWLDTLMVPAGQTWRVAFVADNVGAWALDAEMVGTTGTTASGWFEVT
jgi:FtsP/CotA-like multicopper oxidase with cupredoxin domain